jgi:hypothetical protein
MIIENDFKIGEIIRNKITGREMVIEKLLEIYDVDECKSFKNNIILCSFNEDDKDTRTYIEININNVERIG